MNKKNIGIALSGGGIRAMVFHLGFFKWLAKQSLFEQVRLVSSVSGASLCIGMIYAHNNLEWPTSEQYLTKVLPSIEKALLYDLQLSAIRKLIISPRFWNKKVNIIAKALEQKWGVHGKLSSLTGDPKWHINCTTFETGKRFVFSRERMGDYSIGHVEKPSIPLSEVMAASSGFPIFIGPYVLEPREYSWTPPEHLGKNGMLSSCKRLHLWDGGVYDNFGLESVFKPDNCGTLTEGINYIIVSNASPSIGLQFRRIGPSLKNTKRLLDISMDQVAALRSRSVMDYIKRTGQGMYIKIGNCAKKISKASKCSDELKMQLINCCLPHDQVNRAVEYSTTLRKPSKANYQMLLRHGYEVADCTYQCYQKQDLEE